MFLLFLFIFPAICLAHHQYIDTATSICIADTACSDRFLFYETDIISTTWLIENIFNIHGFTDDTFDVLQQQNNTAITLSLLTSLSRVCTDDQNVIDCIVVDYYLWYMTCMVFITPIISIGVVYYLKDNKLNML